MIVTVDVGTWILISCAIEYFCEHDLDATSLQQMHLEEALLTEWNSEFQTSAKS